jgi:acid stress-induced BolA-like protein IbaG/YrbA
MEIEAIRQMIENVLPDSRLAIEGEGCNFSITVVSQSFEGLNTVKRQKLVLGALQQPLATGALHAISMKTQTPAEAALSDTAAAQPARTG